MSIRTSRPSRLLAALGLAAGSLLPASVPAAAQDASTVLMAPQLRQFEPPSPNASPAELERRGDELRSLKQYLDALDFYIAARKKQSSAVLENKIGITELQMQRFKEARKDFERSIKVDKKYATAYNNLGAVYYYPEKNYKKAIKNYKKAISLDDDVASFHMNLGTAYFARKEYEPALQSYRHALQIDPTVFERHSHTGINAQISSPEDRAQYAFMLAKMYAAAGDVEHCLENLRRAMEDGYKDLDKGLQDADFSIVRKDKRFAELIANRPQALPE